jgi:predicted dehydrogenase
MDKVRIAVVGLGGIAQVMHLPILSRLKTAQITAVCDTNPAKARLVADRYNIKSYYANAQEMLAKSEIDAVDVCVSTHAHKEVCKAALEAGKDVLVEKPIARYYSEAKEIIECAQRNKRKLMVGMNSRFRPDAMILKGFIEGKELGKIFYVKAGWLKQQSSHQQWLTDKNKSGGGVFLDYGIVMLDLALWLMGYPEPLTVSASTYSHETKEVEDSTAVFIKLQNDATLTIEVSWTMLMDKDFLYCNLFGTDGSALINPLRIHKRMHGELVNVTPTKMEKPENLYKRSYEYELQSFITAVQGLHPIISTGEEALHRMKIVEAIYKSAEMKKEVIFK